MASGRRRKPEYGPMTGMSEMGTRTFGAGDRRADAALLSTSRKRPRKVAGGFVQQSIM